MKTLKYNTLIAFMGLALIALIVGCSENQGPDIISPGGSPPRDISGYACVDCHLHPDMSTINPMLIEVNGGDGKHQEHYDDIKIECERCHLNYGASSTHFDMNFDADDPATSIISFDLVNPTGAWVNDTGAGEGQCSTTDCHGSDVPYWYGSQPAMPECVGCHILSEAGAINPLLTAGSGTLGKHDLHFTTRLFGCEKCHNGYDSDLAHRNGVFNSGAVSNNIISFDPTNPSGIWNADNNGAGEGRCATTDCHNPDTLNWYDSTTWATPVCDTCHPMPMGERKPVMGALGNFVENPAMVTFHIANTVDPAEAQCLICHEQTYHMAGLIRLNNADTGATVLLDEADLSTAEPFCLSCHDDDGAMTLGLSNMTPFEDGNTIGVIPYEMSADIKMRWNRQYGHKQKGLTCLGTGEPNTGCHEGGHGSEFAGLLTKRLDLPNPYGNAYTIEQEPGFALCFECHASYPAVTKEVVFGVKAGGNYDVTYYTGLDPLPYPPYNIPNILTKFRDQNYQGTGKPYDDTFTWDTYFNLHFYHVSESTVDWHYRGEDYNWGSSSCTTCHDVHGTDTQWGFIYDEMQYAHYNGTGANINDEYAQMGLHGNNLPNYPINCSTQYNCHGMLDGFGMKLSAWFSPVIE